MSTNPEEYQAISAGEKYIQIAEGIEDLVYSLNERDQINIRIQNAVEHLRHLGVTWGEIGGILGTSKQMAHYHYGRKSN